MAPRWVRKAQWLGMFLGLVLIGGAWAAGTPVGATPDELAHIHHAAGVAGGEIFPEPAAAKYGTGVFHQVPKGLTELCGEKNVYEFCDGVADPHAPVEVGTHVGRYHPLYYAAVGWPLQLWPNDVGLLVARLISVLLVAATLTAATYCAARWSRNRVLVPALIAAGTPMLFHLTGAVNPNALEIAAGALLFCALIPLATAASVNATCVRLAGLAGMILMTLRGFGPLWVGIALFVTFFGVRRARLAELARSKTVRRWSAAVLLAGLLGVTWTVVMKATVGAQVATEHVSALDAIKVMALVQWGALIQQMVGNFGYLSTPLPGIVTVTWAAVVGFFVVGVAALGRRAAKIGLLMLILASVAIPTAATVRGVNTLDFFWQGRYSLPLGVGVVILAAHELAMSGVLTSRPIQRLTRTLVVLLLPAHLLGLFLMLIRWQNNMVTIGIDFPLDPLSSTGWRPLYGPLLPLVAMTVGLVIVAYVYTALVGCQTSDTSQSDDSPADVADARPDPAPRTPAVELAHVSSGAVPRQLH